MKAVILAAGRGSRLGPLTADRPKCMTMIGGRAMLAWQLAAFRAAGIVDITVVVGYRSDVIARVPDIRTIRNARWSKTNMVRSLLTAGAVFTEPVIVSYSDIVYSTDVIAGLVDARGEIVVAYDTAWEELWSARFANPLDDAESFTVDADGYICDIGRRVDSLNEIHGQYLGLFRVSPTGFRWLASYVEAQPLAMADRMDMTTALRGLIGSGYRIVGMPIAGGWCEVDSVTDLALAERWCAAGRLRAPTGFTDVW